MEGSDALLFLNPKSTMALAYHPVQYGTSGLELLSHYYSKTRLEITAPMVQSLFGIVLLRKAQEVC